MYINTQIVIEFEGQVACITGNRRNLRVTFSCGKELGWCWADVREFYAARTILETLGGAQNQFAQADLTHALKVLNNQMNCKLTW